MSERPYLCETCQDTGVVWAEDCRYNPQLEPASVCEEPCPRECAAYQRMVADHRAALELYMAGREGSR